MPTIHNLQWYLTFSCVRFCRAQRGKTAHQRSAHTKLPQGISAALRCGTTQLRNSYWVWRMPFQQELCRYIRYTQG